MWHKQYCWDGGGVSGGRVSGMFLIQIIQIIGIGMKLSMHEKIKYAKILYESRENRRKQIDSLDDNQLQCLRSIYAQKIAFEIVNGELPFLNFNNYNARPSEQTIERSLASNVFWCCYPENNQEYYDVPTAVFLKRLVYPLCFWKSGFFQIHQENVEHYGQTWMVLTYALVLFLAATLTQFFVDPIQYSQNYENVTKCMAIVFIFKLVQPLIHASAISCLGQAILTDHCLMLSGYSLVLYIIPTISCMVPSIYWRIIMLAINATVRTIFLFRNYCTKLATRRFFLLILLVAIQLMYGYIVYRSLFLDYSLGYGFTEAFSAVFGTQPSNTQVASQAPDGSDSASHAMAYALHLRRFQI